MKKIFLTMLGLVVIYNAQAQKQPVDYVNPFIGTTNFGATNPGAVTPHGLMSVTPFNVMGNYEDNVIDKDARWWSMPYLHENKILTGFSHVNLSGVGCPDMASLLLMPTHGDLEVNYRKYGSQYKDEKATPGYFSNYLTKYNIKTEFSATARTSIARFTMPKGQNNILLNLGEGLTNETGAHLRKVSETEFEGSKLLGTFCYTQNQSVYPLYFVMRLNKTPQKTGYWKWLESRSKAEEEWNSDAGTYKVYTQYSKDIAGDDIGLYCTFESDAEEVIEVQIGVSFVSIENARLNLNTEQPTFNFDKVHTDARTSWNEKLSKMMVKGGTEDQKTVFYTGMYHTLIHPNVLQDVNGEYPAHESSEIKKTDGNRYTVFSLWDTYRNVHQMMTLLYPKQQTEMLQTMIGMYKESGWLPKWELYGRESLTMEGDPSIPVIVDSWMKGLRDFDVDAAYEAMHKSALAPSKDNVLRPDNDDYMHYGFVPLRGEFDNSVSHALEYYVADWNLGQFAKALGKKEDAKLFNERSLGYKHYYSKEYGTFRPITPDGKFLSPFNPLQGADFEPNPGFHEGNAWNYTFAVPHDVQGMVKMMGGKKQFVDKLQSVFDNGYFDVTNEPDIHYPYLFSEIAGEEWRTQKLVKDILAEHFTNKPDGLPGNDDTGTLSTWAVFSMMGLYPTCPGDPTYTMTTPTFDEVKVTLDTNFHKSGELTIKVDKGGKDNVYLIDYILVDGKKHKDYKISHEQLTSAKEIVYKLK